MEHKIFLSALSSQTRWSEAAREVVAKIRQGLGGRSCDLLIYFVSETYKDFDAAGCAVELKGRLSPRVMIGCNSSGVIANQTEIEMQPAVAALAIHLPEVKLNPFYLSGADSEDIQTGAELINALDIYPTHKPRFILLADPMTCNVVKLLHAFNGGYKGLPVVGGLASGGVMGKPNWLCLDGRIHAEGAVGVALVGNIEFEIMVSQGCRPIGQSYVMTRVDENVLYELAGRPALDVLRDLIGGLSEKDKALVEKSLSVGIAMSERKTEFRRGDFLIRNIMGFDPDTGALMIGAALKVGQTLQFQLRDAETSSEDLKILLEKLHGQEPSVPSGGVLVTCCGRGRNFYSKPNHDALMIQSLKGPLPLAGFFANGEIGPVGEKNYVHGYTSSLVILR